MKVIQKRCLSLALILVMLLGSFHITTSSANATVKWGISVKTGYWWGDDYPINILKVNDKPAYCLEPHKLISTVEGYTEKKHNFTDEQWNRLVLISHFGYNTGYKSNADFAATQVFIWREIMKWDGEKPFSLNETNIPNLASRVEKIEDRIENYQAKINKKPSFNNKAPITLTVGKEYILKDTNEVLGKYNYAISKLPTGVKATIDKSNHTLKIVASKDAGNTGQISLVAKENNIIDKNRFYYHKDSQNVGNIGYVGNVTASANFQLRRIGNLDIIKKSESGKNIKGAIFKLTDSKGTEVGEYTTDQNGKINILDLTVGTYKVQEVSVPKPYLLDTSIKMVTVSEGQTASVTFTNNLPRGEFSLRKYGEETEKLKGAKFRVWSSGNNPEGKEIDFNKEFITDKNGQIKISGLELGKYFYQEIKAPDGYLRDNKVYTFEIQYDSDKKPVVLLWQDRYNKKPTGEFQLIKYGEDKKEKLKDAKYKIWSDDKSFEKEFTTDRDGKIRVTNLKLGKYYYREIKAPYGYVADDKVYEFEIRYKDDETPLIKVSEERENKKVMGKFQLVKYDRDKSNLLKDAHYKIWSEDKKFNREYITDNSGKIQVDNLDLGKYYYQEIKAPYGYIRDDKIYEFELKYNDDKTPVVEIKREMTNDTPTGQLLLKKYNEDGSTLLKGASFKIWSEDEKFSKEYITDENGEIVVDNLPLGHYYYQEIKAPKGYILDDVKYDFELNYLDDVTPIVTIHREMINKEPKSAISVRKSLSGVENLPKEQRKNISPKGAMYMLYAREDITNAAGTVKYYKADDRVGMFFIDENGLSEKIENLPIGHYYIKEVKAPKGCLLDKSEYDIDIKYVDENTELINWQLNVQDEVIKPAKKQVNTGDDFPVGALMLIAGLAAIATGILAIKKKD